MDADFPAAHSMDTTWFATDRDGRIGYFESGSAGAVPRDALSGPAAERVQEQLTQEARAARCPTIGGGANRLALCTRAGNTSVPLSACLPPLSCSSSRSNRWK